MNITSMLLELSKEETYDQGIPGPQYHGIKKVSQRHSRIFSNHTDGNSGYDAIKTGLHRGKALHQNDNQKENGKKEVKLPLEDLLQVIPVF